MMFTPKVMSARIFQINTSRGGVPKRATRTVDVESEGITVDKQRDRRVHGGPDRAIAIYALERILALQEEGHPIFPGSTGENITTVGLDQEILVPGVRLKLGSQLVVEVASYCSPCRTIEASFIGGEFNRISQKVHPGWSRVYARVIEPGSVSAGDAIHVLD
jgi:MOSC domain-containing protein YiiM